VPIVILSKPQLSETLTGVLVLLKRHAEATAAGAAPKARRLRLAPKAAEAMHDLAGGIGAQIRVPRDSYQIEFATRDMAALVDTMHERFAELRKVYMDSRGSPALRQAAREEWAVLASATEALERALVEDLPAGKLRSVRGTQQRWKRERALPEPVSAKGKETSVMKKAKKAAKKPAKKTAKKKAKKK